MTNLFKINQISKRFRQPDKSELIVLKDLSLDVQKGTIIAVTGVSGSGKSTLLHLMGALDRPDEGDILWQGDSILAFSRKQQTHFRNQLVGFIFQFHYLMPELNVRENVAFPFLMHNFNKVEAYEKAEKILIDVGLKDKCDYMPYQLSGGEGQRAAIARGLINGPEILLADEPTGNLDWKTGEKVFNIFRDLLIEKHLTAVIVTHNEALARLTDQHYHLHEGTVNRER